MRRILKTAAMIVVLMIAACSIIPEAPMLILPDEGEVFDTIPPTFVWSSVSHTEGYLLRAVCDAGVVYGDVVCIYQYLDDTTFTPPLEEFMHFQEDNYDWCVASYWVEGSDTQYVWSEWRTFHVDRPVEIPFNLDTTYFPFGLGYEWCYERHVWGGQLGETGWEPWDWYDTIYIKVIDSFWEDDTLILNLEGNFLFLGNPVRIWDNKTPLYAYLDDTLKFPPQEIDRTEETEHSIGIYTTHELTLTVGDSTLSMYSTDIHWSDFDYYVERYGMSILAEKEVGPKSQNSWHTESYGGGDEYSSNTHSRLLWFYDGTDTLYKASDEPLSIQSLTEPNSGLAENWRQ